MPTLRKVAVLIGSLRKESFTRKVANAVIKVAPASLSFETIEINELPLYNQDLESATPSAWVGFRNKLRTSDAVLFATPEYNRSVPGVLKNAIDVGSRPREASAFNGKPGAVISVSPGALAAFGDNHHLRQMLVFLNVPTMQQP
jgi:chromate reductase